MKNRRGWNFKNRPATPIADRFWKFVSKQSSGCWEWIGCLSTKGYGKIAAGRDRYGVREAHRVSWEIHNGKIPDGKWVLHRCDNPPCVNPEHLWLGTARENVRDCVSKGRFRGNPLKGLAHGYHKIDKRIADEMRAMYSKGDCSISSIARMFSVEHHTVSAVLKNLRWI